MVRLPLGKEAICLILLPRYGYDGWVDEAFLEYLADGFHLPRKILHPPIEKSSYHFRQLDSADRIGAQRST